MPNRGGRIGRPAESVTTDAVESVTTDADVGTTEAVAETTAGTDASEGSFPVSIDNMFGTTVIESKPERVVSIGYTEGDYVLALGVTPVAIRDWYGEQPGGLWPWAAESPAADDSIVVLQPDSLNFEKVAELDPDVIVAMVSEIEQADYDRLTEIAPVLAQTDEYVRYGTPWDEVQLTIGKALGLEAEAQAIVDDVSAQIADAAAAHPDWAGQTANFVVPAADGTWYAYTDQDSRGRLLTELGFTIPQPILDLAGDLFYAQGSGENLALVDADLVTYVTRGTRRGRRASALAEHSGRGRWSQPVRRSRSRRCHVVLDLLEPAVRHRRTWYRRSRRRSVADAFGSRSPRRTSR